MKTFLFDFVCCQEIDKNRQFLHSQWNYAQCFGQGCYLIVLRGNWHLVNCLISAPITFFACIPALFIFLVFHYGTDIQDRWHSRLLSLSVHNLPWFANSVEVFRVNWDIKLSTERMIYSRAFGGPPAAAVAYQLLAGNLRHLCVQYNEAYAGFVSSHSGREPKRWSIRVDWIPLYTSSRKQRGMFRN